MPKSKAKPKKTSSAKKTAKIESTSKLVRKNLTGSFKLLKSSSLLLLEDWKTVSLILLTYMFATLFFSSGLVTVSDVSQVKSLNPGVHGLHGTWTLLSSLLSSGFTSSSGNAGGQTVLFVIFSLVIIWYLRQLNLKKHPRTRDALYKSQTALIPFF